MKKIVGSLLLLAIVLTIVFPVIALASSSTPLTAKEMSASVGGLKPVSCGDYAEMAWDVCRQFGGGWLTCLGSEILIYIVCALA